MGEVLQFIILMDEDEMLWFTRLRVPLRPGIGCHLPSEFYQNDLSPPFQSSLFSPLTLGVISSRQATVPLSFSGIFFPLTQVLYCLPIAEYPFLPPRSELPLVEVLFFLTSGSDSCSLSFGALASLSLRIPFHLPLRNPSYLPLRFPFPCR